jgi:uncharacterized membrane protein YccC
MDDATTITDTGWADRNRAWMRLSLRLTLAGLLAFAVGHLLRVAQPSWAVLTALIVTQASVGGALKAAVDRFVGSLGGAAWGVGVSLVLPRATLWELGLTLAVALAPLAVVTALRPAYRVAPVTAVILLLAPVSQAAGPFAAAVDRLLEIGLGSAVALAVAFLVLPERAHGMLARAAARALDLMAELVVALAPGLAAPRDTRLVESLNSRIRKTIIAAESIAEEAARERRISLAASVDPQPLCRTLRRLHNDLAMVGRAGVEPLVDPIRRALAGPAIDAGAAIALFLRQGGHALAAQGPAPSPEGVEQALARYAAAVADLRRSGLTRALPDDDVGRIFGLTFALEQLRGNLRDLADRAGEMALAAKA